MNELQMIQSKWNIHQSSIKTFIDRFPEDTTSNNCRYDLIYTWVRQGKLTFRQFKILTKNIRIRNITEWKQMNGDYFFNQISKEIK